MAQEDVARLEVVVDDGGLDLVEVLECGDGLTDDGAGLLLRDTLVLLEVEVQVVPLTELQHRAEPAAHGEISGCRGYTVYCEVINIRWTFYSVYFVGRAIDK